MQDTEGLDCRGGASQATKSKPHSRLRQALSNLLQATRAGESQPRDSEWASRETESKSHRRMV